MGAYYSWVNIDRREYLQCGDLEDGRCKLYQMIWYDCMGVRALYALLDGEWRGQRILLLGDEGEPAGDGGNAALARLIGERRSWSAAGGLFDYVAAHYRDITPLFQESEGVCRAEIDWILNDPHRFDPYRIDRSDPFRGLFGRCVRDYRFVINDTRGAYLDRERAQSHRGFLVNPLPLLLACAAFDAEPFIGAWMGDSLRVSDSPPPETYRDMSAIYRVEG